MARGPCARPGGASGTPVASGTTGVPSLQAPSERDAALVSEDGPAGCRIAGDRERVERVVEAPDTQRVEGVHLAVVARERRVVVGAERRTAVVVGPQEAKGLARGGDARRPRGERGGHRRVAHDVPVERADEQVHPRGQRRPRVAIEVEPRRPALDVEPLRPVAPRRGARREGGCGAAAEGVADDAESGGVGARRPRGREVAQRGLEAAPERVVARRASRDLDGGVDGEDDHATAPRHVLEPEPVRRRVGGAEAVREEDDRCRGRQVVSRRAEDVDLPSLGDGVRDHLGGDRGEPRRARAGADRGRRGRADAGHRLGADPGRDGERREQGHRAERRRMHGGQNTRGRGESGPVPLPAPTRRALVRPSCGRDPRRARAGARRAAAPRRGRRAGRMRRRAGASPARAPR